MSLPDTWSLPLWIWSFDGRQTCPFVTVFLPVTATNRTPAFWRAWPRVRLHRVAPHAKARQDCRRMPHMILYPAIDLKDGQAVRLVHGDMDRSTVFNDDPAAQARAFVDAGCEWLHLVDLNGAFAGEPVNAAPVEAILAATNVPAQLGGGIREMATIERWLSRGLARVILGTVAVENPALVREAARAFPGQVAVGIDARGGRVATKGWAEETDVNATDLARSFEDAGVAAIIYTDITRDGSTGPRRLHPSHRIGRRLFARRSPRAEGHRSDLRRNLRPRALRRRHRPGGGARRPGRLTSQLRCIRLCICAS